MQLDKYTISEHELIAQAIEIIDYNNTRCVIVINETNKVVGILSEGDILRAILKGVSIMSPVKSIMVTNFKYLLTYDDEKIKFFFKKGITLIPILNEQNNLIDIVAFTSYIESFWK
jgi:CBS domain-containing protein